VPIAIYGSRRLDQILIIVAAEVIDVRLVGAITKRDGLHVELHKLD